MQSHTHTNPNVNISSSPLNVDTTLDTPQPISPTPSSDSEWEVLSDGAGTKSPKNQTELKKSVSENIAPHISIQDITEIKITSATQQSNNPAEQKNSFLNDSIQPISLQPEPLVKEFDIHSATLNEQKQTITQLQEDIGIANKAVQQQHDALKESIEIRNTLQNILNITTAEKRDLERTIEEEIQNKKKIENDFSSAQTELRIKKTTNKQLNEQLENFKNNLNKQEEKSYEDNSKIHFLNTHIEDLTEKYQETLDKLNQLSIKNQQLTEQLENLQNNFNIKIGSFNSQIEILTEESQENFNKYNQLLEESIKKTVQEKNKLTTLTEEKNTLVRSFSETQDELTIAKASLLDKENENSDLRNSNLMKNEDVITLQKNIDQIKKESEEKIRTISASAETIWVEKNKSRTQAEVLLKNKTEIAELRTQNDLLIAEKIQMEKDLAILRNPLRSMSELEKKGNPMPGQAPRKPATFAEVAATLESFSVFPKKKNHAPISKEEASFSSIKNRGCC